jgi:DNA-binding transcriptional MerR regulator
MLTESFTTSTSAFFPIRELVQRTGVNASTLRAWENRHGLLNPVRTESGHRLYSQNDVQRVRRVQELLVQGLSLNEIAPLLDAAAEATGRPPSQHRWRLKTAGGNAEPGLAGLPDGDAERAGKLQHGSAGQPLQRVVRGVSDRYRHRAPDDSGAGAIGPALGQTALPASRKNISSAPGCATNSVPACIMPPASRMVAN